MKPTSVVRASYGAFLLIAPGRLLGLGHPSPPGWAGPVARVLGLRHLLQAVVLDAHPQLAPAGAAADFLHALTDVGAAAGERGLRAPALLDAAVATALGIGDLLA